MDKKEQAKQHKRRDTPITRPNAIQINRMAVSAPDTAVRAFIAADHNLRLADLQRRYPTLATEPMPSRRLEPLPEAPGGPLLLYDPQDTPQAQNAPQSPITPYFDTSLLRRCPSLIVEAQTPPRSPLQILPLPSSALPPPQGHARSIFDRDQAPSPQPPPYTPLPPQLPLRRQITDGTLPEPRPIPNPPSTPPPPDSIPASNSADKLWNFKG